MHRVHSRYWGLLLLFFLAYAVFNAFFGEFRMVFGEFQLYYYVLETATGFFDYMLFFHILVLFVYWHWHRKNPVSTTHIVSHVFILCLPVVMVYTLVVFLVNPYMELVKGRQQATTSYLIELVAGAEEALADDDPQRAMNLLQQYMGLTKRDEPIESLYIQAQAAQQGSSQLVSASQDTLPIQLREQNAAKLYKIAEEHYFKDDYVSSFHYAGAAALLSEPPREDALVLQRDSRALLQEGILLQEENATRRLFFRKSEAIQTLLAGTLDPTQSLKAYRLLRELVEDYPDDTEIARRYRESLMQLSEQSFFLSQASIDENRPGFYNTWFVEESESNYQVFFAQHISYSENINYAFGVEILHLDKESFQTRLHIRAALAQVIDNVVMLNGVDDAGEVQAVQVLAGSAAPLIFTFDQSIVARASRNLIQRNWQTVGLLDFFQVLQASNSRVRGRMISYLIAQGIILFLFVIAAFWTGIIVAQHMPRPQKKEWYSWLFIPLIGLVTLMVHTLIMQSIDVLSIALYRLMGAFGAISVATGLIVLLLIAGMIRIQSSISEKE